MRCHQCRSTGYTEDELKAHVAKTGHKLHPDRAEWSSINEFDSTPPKTLSKAELIAAFKDLFTAEDLQDTMKQLGWIPPPDATPRDNTAAKGGSK